jgi:hypothetical protein
VDPETATAAKALCAHRLDAEPHVPVTAHAPRTRTTDEDEDEHDDEQEYAHLRGLLRGSP